MRCFRPIWNGLSSVYTCSAEPNCQSPGCVKMVAAADAAGSDKMTIDAGWVHYAGRRYTARKGALAASSRRDGCDLLPRPPAPPAHGKFFRTIRPSLGPFSGHSASRAASWIRPRSPPYECFGSILLGNASHSLARLFENSSPIRPLRGSARTFRRAPAGALVICRQPTRQHQCRHPRVP